MFLISRAVLVVVMGSFPGGANKLSTGSDLTESLSCLGNPTHLLPTSPKFPWSRTCQQYRQDAQDHGHLSFCYKSAYNLLTFV